MPSGTTQCSQQTRRVFGPIIQSVAKNLEPIASFVSATRLLSAIECLWFGPISQRSTILSGFPIRCCWRNSSVLQNPIEKSKCFQWPFPVTRLIRDLPGCGVTLAGYNQIWLSQALVGMMLVSVMCRIGTRFAQTGTLLRCDG